MVDKGALSFATATRDVPLLYYFDKREIFL